VFQGYWWASLAEWEVSVDGSQPFWITRVFAGLCMAAGLVVFLYNFYMTWRGAEATFTEPEMAPAAVVR
jgi:cytochrome c oxidase cbb3-type subunit 1